MGRSPVRSQCGKDVNWEVGEEGTGMQRVEVVVLFAAPGVPMIGLTSSACRA